MPRLGSCKGPQKKSDARIIGEAFILFGSIVAMIIGALFIVNFSSLLRFGFWFFNLNGMVVGMGYVIQGVLLISLSLVVLDTCGSIKIPFIQLANDWVVILVLGVVMFLLGGHIGALIVVVGALLLPM